MKKHIQLLAWLLLFPFLLTACGGDGGSSVSSNENASSTTTTTTATTTTTTTTTAAPVSDIFASDEVPDADEGVFLYKTSKGVELYLNLQQPRTKVYEYAPLIVNIGGGGWLHYQITRSPFYTMGKEAQLRDEGFANLCVGFRGADNGEQMPDIVADVIDALGYIAKYNDVFKIDLQKIVTTGHSAGGHVSLLVAMMPAEIAMQNCVYKDFSYKCIGSVALAAPTMMYKDEELGVQLFPDYLGAGYPNSGPDVLGHLFGTTVSADPEPFIKYSPITYVRADMPSIFLLSAEKDTAIAPLQHTRFKEAALAAGGNCTLVELKNGNHALLPTDGDLSPTQAEYSQQMYDFVKGLLK